MRGNSLLCVQQLGFLPHHSTVTQLCLLTHRWQLALDKRDSIETAFLDLSKAYDRVTIPGLIYKLSLYGFSRAAIEWFSAFLTNRQQRTLQRTAPSQTEVTDLNCLDHSTTSKRNSHVASFGESPSDTHSRSDSTIHYGVTALLQPTTIATRKK